MATLQATTISGNTPITSANIGSQSVSAATNATNASNLVSTNWTVYESSNVLYFKYGGVNKAKLDSSGNLTVVGNVTAYGSV